MISWRFAGISAFVSAMISAVICIPLAASFGWIVGLPPASTVDLMFLMDRVLSLRLGEHWITYATELWLLPTIFVCALGYLVVSQKTRGWTIDAVGSEACVNCPDDLRAGVGDITERFRYQSH